MRRAKLREREREREITRERDRERERGRGKSKKRMNIQKIDRERESIVYFTFRNTSYAQYEEAGAF